MSITEVSRIAGVSIATVSRVINNHRWVSPATAELVRNAIRESGYQPPSSSRRGRGQVIYRSVAGEMTSIALLFPDPGAAAIKTVLSGRVTHGMNQFLAKHGISLVLTSLADWEKMPACIERRQVGGVVLRGTVPVEHLYPMIKGLPCVTIFETVTPPSYGDQVLDDNTGIGVLAAQYLRGRGCRSVAFINRDVLHPAYAVRGDSFARAARGEGTDCRMITRPAPMEELLSEMLSGGQKVEGVFVPGNEDQIEPVYRELIRRGIRPGKDIEFISCFYDQSRLRTLDAGLANIDINPEMVGAAAAETLLWRIENPTAPRRRMLIDPVLVPAGAGK